MVTMIEGDITVVQEEIAVVRFKGIERCKYSR
jgi:hypothetical protein